MKAIKISILLGILVMMVCGCSSKKYEWRKAGVAPEQITKDCRECAKKMQINDNVANYDDFRRSQNIGQHGSMELEVSLSDSRNSSTIINCMTVRGYRRVLVDF